MEHRMRFLFCALVLVSSFANAQGGGGGGTIVDGWLDTQPLPVQFEKGICVDYIYGNINWFQFYNPPGYSPYAGPYSAARCAALLTSGDGGNNNSNDFFRLKQAGFGHIRITLDPWALGMKENGVNGSPDVTVPYSTPLAPSPIMQALRQDVMDATSQGLGVILDFHPIVLAPGDWRNQINQYLKDKVQPITSVSLTNFEYAYPGTYGYHFFEEGVNGGLPPLARFWQSFAPHFYDIPGSTIAFEIMNEPLQRAWENKQWTISGPGGPTSWVVQTDGIGHSCGLPLQNGNRQESADWIENRTAAWRSLTKAAVNAIDLQGHPNLYAIISHGDQQLASLKWSDFKPLESSDVAAYQQLIYGFHLYNPIKFTHPDSVLQDSSVPVGSDMYMESRDFVRDQNSPPEIYFDQYWHPVQLVFTNLDTWLDNCSKKPSQLQGAIWMRPNVMVTEFGVARREVNQRWYPGAPPQLPIQFMPRKKFNAQWAWDVRSRMTSRGIGWTYYSLAGAFGYCKGNIFSTSNYQLHGDWDLAPANVSDYMNLGLFSATRPEQ